MGNFALAEKKVNFVVFVDVYKPHHSITLVGTMNCLAILMTCNIDRCCVATLRNLALVEYSFLHDSCKFSSARKRPILQISFRYYLTKQPSSKS